MTREHGKKIVSMFDRISPRYDLLNRLLSGFQDMSWRRKAVSLLGDLSEKNALDLCCGSGDFLKLFKKKYGANIALIGVDFARQMLGVAKKRLDPMNKENVVLCQADALSLPCANSSIHAVTIGFGIRNIIEKKDALAEIIRVLSPGGKLVIIEPAVPKNRFLASLFSFYFRHIMPVIGGLISGDFGAYKYLNVSVESFPKPDDFCNLMRDCGFSNVRANPQTCGSAMIYFGEKLSL